MFGKKYDLTTKKGIEKLKTIKNPRLQKKIISKQPEVILYASKYWCEGKDFKTLVFEALVRKPELILGFKDQYGLMVNYENVKMAVLTDPMIMSKMNDDMKSIVTVDLFINAFIKNPLVLTIKDLPCLKSRLSRNIIVVEDGKQVTKKLSTTLRTECLKAIRLSESVSHYHAGYDDLALQIAEQLKDSRSFQNTKYSTELLGNFATLMNAMIKKSNQKLRACSVDAWRVNNGKPMYKAVRTSAKKNSELEGLITDMPTNMLPEKIVKKLVIQAVLTNPEFYLKLSEYGFERYVEDGTVKYNVYKSLKKHGMLKQSDRFLREEDVKKAKNKTAGVEKRKVYLKRPRNPKLPAVIEQEENKEDLPF